ncbi:MAG: FxsA family protein [Rhizobiaceae bacterium]|nr:FxsA family protein [Rhizobiaceae bacterium]
MPLILIPVLLLILPAVEIFVFIKVGQAIGAWKVVGLIFLSAILGAALLRFQSVGVIRKLDRDLRRGHTPEAGLFDGFLIAIGAILLIIPGFVSDVFGLMLMIPFMRRLIRRHLASRITVTGFGNYRRGFRRWRQEGDDVVDLSPEDFERQKPREPPRPTIDHRD